MLAQLVSVACSLALSAPCAATRAEASFRPYLSGFSAITAIASTPAEPRRLYVVEQVGRIRYLVNGRLSGTFLDIRSRVASGGERGLLSVAFSPAYATNHRFYVNYTDLNGNTRVVEYRSRKGKAIRSSARQILFVRQPYPNHNGGQLQFGPDKLLYVGMGDGGSSGDPGNRAQNLSIRLGKLMRTDPYVRRPAWRIVGYGLRNPWRFSFDPANGDLYIADVGQGAWEEVNYRPRSQLNALTNYGWNLYEGRARYRAGSPNSTGQLAFPVAAYDHGEGSCSLALHAARLRLVGGELPDHERDTGCRPESSLPLRRGSGRTHPQADGRRRAAGVVAGDHAAPATGEDRGLAQLLARPRHRDDRRGRRRRAAVPRPRGNAPAEHGCDRPRLELALQQPPPADPAELLRRERFGDLGPGGGRRRAGERTAARRDRQRALERAHELGRQCARAHTHRVAAAPELDAAKPRRAQPDGRRPRQHLARLSRTWPRAAGRGHVL